ncbi:hypothetical protein [Coleofasciculus sp.]
MDLSTEASLFPDSKLLSGESRSHAPIFWHPRDGQESAEFYVEEET